MTIKRAGCYERVSTEEQSLRGFSIETQIANLKDYCADNNIKIVDHYTDEGISGAKPPLKRPALQRLLDDVEAGKIDVILFTKLDRWFRSVKEYFKVQEILDKHRVEWKAIHENYDTSTANGQMAITIFLAVAQNERDRTAERIKVVFEHKRKNKEACFGSNSVPFGYIKQEDENGVMRLVKDPETREAIEDFWRMYLATNNLNKTARHMLNAYGIKRSQKSWMRMTRSEFYCGMYRGVCDYCEPYVSMEDFLRIQEQHPIKQTPSGRSYYFKGLLRCPECGSKMGGGGYKRNKVVYKSYRCSKRTTTCSNNRTYSERKIEKMLLANLDVYLTDEIAIIEVENMKPHPKPKTDIKKLKEMKRRLTVVYMDPDGDMTDEEYQQQNSELAKLIEKAEQTAPPEPKETSHLKKLLETDFRSLYVSLDDEEKQLFWLKLIEEIEMDGKKIKRIRFN